MKIVCIYDHLLLSYTKNQNRFCRNPILRKNYCFKKINVSCIMYLRFRIPVFLIFTHAYGIFGWLPRYGITGNTIDTGRKQIPNNGIKIWNIASPTMSYPTVVGIYVVLLYCATVKSEVRGRRTFVPNTQSVSSSLFVYLGSLI